MTGRATTLLLLVGCSSLRTVEGDLPCLEAGYAIARRTFECTGDAELANARYVRFEAEYECVVVDYPEIEEPNEYLVGEEGLPGDWFHCSFAIGELACELVDAYGDDIDQWLTASPSCSEVVR